jgi:hypothetical protein
MNKLTPVTYPYGATSAPYSPSRPHRGNDRAGKDGEPIYIGSTVIANVGSTGWSTGNHLHTQAGTDIGCQATFNPSSIEFKGGTVVRTGWGDQWGNYITIQVGSKYVTYCHLSKINVKVSQVIKEDEMTQEEVGLIYKLDGRVASAAAKKLHATKGTPKSLVTALIKDSPKLGNQKKINDLKKQLADVKKALANEKNKPPQTVIKEVERIVEKEVIKEVPVGEEQAVRGFFDKLLNLIFKK